MKNKKIQITSYHILTSLVALVMMYPLLWLVSSSLKDTSQIFVNAHQLIPKEWSFDNYVSGWKGFGKYTFTTFFRNSLTVSVIETIGAVLASAVVAYGFARLSFKGSRLWFSMMMMTMMLPAQVLVIPQYILFKELGWINTFYPLIIPTFFGAPFYIFLIMQFIQGLPRELDESAKVDGCNPYRIFTSIFFPLLMPVMVTSAIFKFYWSWEDFFGPLIYLSQPKLFTLPLALRMFIDPTGTDWGGMFAMSVLSLLPVILIFLVFQRYITEGISTTGMKG
jgi:multiple sugar transport system permease protein